MVINGKTLLQRAPIKGMIGTKERDHGVSYGLGEAGYDIRIKQEVMFEPASYHGFDKAHMIAPDRVYLDGVASEKNRFCRFVIASAIEEFDMPDSLVAVVHDKSTWARQGVSVFNTVIEPGWKGFLTLEIVFYGNAPVTIPAGSGIAQVIFHRVSEPAEYVGKYQNQSDEPVPSRFE